jgi:hypothetical protein
VLSGTLDVMKGKPSKALMSGVNGPALALQPGLYCNCGMNRVLW